MRYLLGVALLNFFLAGTNGQLTASESVGSVFLFSTPIYCNALVPQLQTCPPQPCYAANTRSQCCMGIYRSTTGGLYQQCKCNNAINCNTAPLPQTPTTSTTTSTTPTTTTTTPSTTTASTTTTTISTSTPTSAPFYYDMPLYCSAVTTDMPKFCGTPDFCYQSTTRDSCCLTTSRVTLTDEFRTIAYFPQCRCSASVPCDQFIGGRSLNVK